MDSKAYAKEHKQAFIAKVVKGKVPVLEEKLAIFMAGTPGAGKTEVVESLMEFANDEELCVIDSDRFRAQFPGYNGSLKSLFLHGTIEEQEVVLNEASRRALIKQQEVIDLAESIDN